VERYEGHLDLFGFLDGSGRTTTRVKRTVTGARAAVCREHRGFTSLTLEGRRAYRGRFSLALDTRVFPSPFTGGRCAGPRLSDFAGSLPSAVVRLRKIRRRGARVSLAGRFPFVAGAFTGEVVSTLRLRTRRTRTETLRDGRPRHGRPPRMLSVSISYKLKSAQGGASADFRAVDSPLCRMLDACGTSGHEGYSLTTHGGSLVVFGAARTRGRHAPKLRRAIATLLRHGYLYGFGEVGGKPGETTDVVTRPASATCTDRMRASRPGLLVERRNHKLRMALGPANFLSSDTGAVFLHARCPGPTQGDVLRGSDLARTKLSAASLTRRTLRTVMTSAHGFRTHGYQGTEAGRFELELERTHVSVKVGREGVGAPIGGGNAVVVIGTASAGAAQRP
jgi:hypothetical protein